MTSAPSDRTECLQGDIATNWIKDHICTMTAGQGLDRVAKHLLHACSRFECDLFSPANNAGFDPTVVTQAPNDANLQAAIGAAWHA
jgi:hypothetical protein